MRQVQKMLGLLAGAILVLSSAERDTQQILLRLMPGLDLESGATPA